MKKLSDYRIREENGKFYIETKVKYSITNICSTEEPVMREGYFDVTDSKGNCIIGLPLKSEFKNEFNTLEAAKAQVIKWCEEPKKPKYHYVREFERYSYYYDEKFEYFNQKHKEFLEKKEKERKFEESIKKAQEIADAAIKIINCFAKTEQQMKDEITENDVVDSCKRQFDEKFNITNTTVEGKHFSADDLKDARDIIFINEALKINPLFYKLIEKYEERVKSGWNPKTIEKSYADLTLENFELTIKNKELEIQLHELKKKQKK